MIEILSSHHETINDTELVHNKQTEKVFYTKQKDMFTLNRTICKFKRSQSVPFAL